MILHHLQRVPPDADEYGRVRCRVCGLVWTTSPEQDALLADLFDHDATHAGPGDGGEAGG